MEEEAAEPSVNPSMAAHRMPADILQTIQGSLPLVDYFRFPAVCTARRSASRDRRNLHRLPLLCSLSEDGTTLIAIDGLSNIAPPKVHMIPLPDHLHGHELLSSIGRCLLLEKRGSLAGIRLFNPFYSQAASLPPSASLSPKSRDPQSVRIRTVVTDTTGTKVYALDFSDVTLVDMTSNLPNNYSKSNSHQVLDWCCYQSASLVNLGSSLFLVRWRTTLRKVGVKQRREMDVFRLDDCSKEWVPVKSLGDHSFFIGRNLSISMSTVDFPELKSNRVYLCFDALARISGDMYSCPYYDEFRYHLFYDIEDGSWGEFYDAESQIQIDCHPRFSVWMLPPADNLSRLAIR